MLLLLPSRGARCYMRAMHPVHPVWIRDRVRLRASRCEHGLTQRLLSFMHSLCHDLLSLYPSPVQTELSPDVSVAPMGDLLDATRRRGDEATRHAYDAYAYNA